jgi:hypothetical protein
MSGALYRGRNSAGIETSHLRVTVLCEGGHIAEILDKQTGIVQFSAGRSIFSTT